MLCRQSAASQDEHCEHSDVQILRVPLYFRSNPPWVSVNSQANVLQKTSESLK